MIYVIAIRRTGRLIVVADEAPDLLARKGDRLIGLEYEILVGFARELGLDLSIRFVPRHAVEVAGPPRRGCRPGCWRDRVHR